MLMRRRPQGAPRAAAGSEVKVTGRSQRDVTVRGMREEVRMDLLRRVRSLAEENMLPALEMEVSLV